MDYTEAFNDYLTSREAHNIINEALKPFNRTFHETFGSGGFEAGSRYSKLLVCCSPGWVAPNEVCIQIQDAEEGELIDAEYQADYPITFTDDNKHNLQEYIAVLIKACEDANRLEKSLT